MRFLWCFALRVYGGALLRGVLLGLFVLVVRQSLIEKRECQHGVSCVLHDGSECGDTKSGEQHGKRR
jgi:hypothetical protein